MHGRLWLIREDSIHFNNDRYKFWIINYGQRICMPLAWPARRGRA